MRNDADDELENIPSLTAGRDREVPYPTPVLEPRYKPAESRESRDNEYRPRQKRRSVGVGPLWAMVAALILALGGLGWWSFQQISKLEMQLVATQETFGRIVEDADGRVQDIFGKVMATESSATTASEAVKLRIKQLEKQVIDLTRQQRAFTTEQQSLAGRQSNQDQRLQTQDKRLEGLAAELQGQQGSVATLTKNIEALGNEQASLKSSLSEQAALAATVSNLSKEITALKKQGNSSQAISRIEQDLLILRSELDNRPAQQRTNTAEFDAFRAQVTRRITTLQNQIANLQGQIDAR